MVDTEESSTEDTMVEKWGGDTEGHGGEKEDVQRSDFIEAKRTRKPEVFSQNGKRSPPRDIGMSRNGRGSGASRMTWSEMTC